ncbi:hypothetical protein DFH11DRAFT_1629972 [Phellopilus nigrolimitatus]|nr:hypothetical protein DFH11DRAFT_1629972 [Phellopilus nigrolimitatus]
MAVLLSSIRDSLASTAQASMCRLILNDLPYTRCFIIPPPYLYYHRAMLSVCTSHWKPAAERDGIAITVLLDVYNAETTRDFCVANFFLLESVSDTADAGASGHPRLSHLGLPESIALDEQPNMFSLMSPPSQAGATAISFYNKTLHRDPPEVVRKLATISREKEVVFSSLDLPYAASLSVESYSGALYFPTIDSTSIVIQYFD